MKNSLSKSFFASFFAAASLSFWQFPQALAQQAVYATGQYPPAPTPINAYQGWPTSYPAFPPMPTAYQQTYPQQYNQVAQPVPQETQEAEIEKEDRPLKAKEPALSPYEQQELALKHSREEYGAPEKMPSPDYNHLDLESQYNQASAPKATKFKNVMRNAGKIIGATAAVAIPVTSLVLMSRQAARTSSGGMFNRISGF